MPDFGPKRSWNDFLSNAIASGPPYHRGRDLFLTPGDEQWIIGKFTYYFPIDKDLKGEDIDVWLLRDCGTSWEFLGTAQTSKDNMHATVEGVPDTGGRIYFKIPAGKELGLGRHRVHLVVAGDHTGTELFIEVVPKGTHIFVTDIDGTLTTTETEEFTALLTGATPNANPGAAQALTTLAAKGYRPYYLSARPEFLVERSREFVKLRGFPPGIIHTNTNLTGALGSAAAAYKLADLQVVASHGIDTSYGIGNTDSDAAAYFDDGINPSDHRILYKFTDSVHNGRRVDDYSALFAEFAALPTVCP